MSELINARIRNENFRRALLTNVSLVALMGVVCAPISALAASADEDRPTVWIEIGGQLERVDTPQTPFAPPFFGLAQSNVLDAMVDTLRPSRYSIGGEGKITLLPATTDWAFSAAARYGRSKNARHLHYQTPGLPSFTERVGAGLTSIKPSLRNFGDGQSDFAESDFVLDFQAGKDIGLGVFGSSGSSVISAGVRYAQFTSSSDAAIHARPVLGYGPAIPVTVIKYHGSVHFPFNQTYTAALHTTHSTHAVGPSVSWGASLPVAGKPDGMAVVFDWGVNGALLFGRQRTSENHQTTGYGAYHIGTVKHTHSYAHTAADVRSKAVIIPNIGGFAGISLEVPNGKVSIGYRGDFFFNATDSGLDAREAANKNFYGPFATISIGLGG